ncbi:MAG: type VI secretion system tip protein VgrG [Ketobacter sp.]|nr:MAG: type VI secretion system tip protein VgrG [Ketobacter sp.]
MSFPANNSRFALQVPSLDDEVRVVSFRYQAAIATPFECIVELASERRDLPLDKLLGKSAVLTLYDERHPRHIHGEMVQLAQGSIGKRFTSYRVTLRPKIALLAMRSGMRIFQDRTAQEIVTQVLREAGVPDDQVRWQNQAKPSAREYCVQYRETDLQFVSRLLEEEGLFYFFEHSLAGHILVIADHNRVFQPMPGEASLPYRARSGMVSGEESVYEFHAQQQLQSGAIALRDYGFQKPANRLESKAEARDFPELQHYRYPGHFQDNGQGRAYVQAQLQGHQVQREHYELESDCLRLALGCRFGLKQHGTQGFNQQYVVTALTVEGKQPQVLEEGASEEGSRFAVQARVISAGESYRPELQHPRPRISGVQTAFVTGPKGEEIYTDQYGRIKVQFHWDRQGKRDESSSCWLRVSQAWAGNQWGAQSLPRIGQEVIVSFLNGDPDSPLVTGSLYNAATQPPYGLPANKTRTTFKSQSSPGAGGYNELRMEDKKGSEQLFIHGQKDVDLYVKNHRMENIDHDRHRIVAAAAMEKVGKDYSNKTGANRNLKVGQTLSQNIGGNVNQKAGQNWLEKTGADYSLKAGTSVVLDAGMSVTLKAGGGTIVLNPGGVAITGTMVRINSGGGAGSAKGASPTAPKSPKPVDPGKPGSAIPAIGASARFKQRPVEFDESKGKEVDEGALKALGKTYVHGSPKRVGNHSSSKRPVSGGTSEIVGVPSLFAEVYSKAPAAKLEIDAMADEIAALFGGQVAKAPVKSQERAIQKIMNDYGGNVARIKDLARNTIIVSPDKMDLAIGELVGRGAKVKVIDGDTDPLGYSGANSTIKTQAGIVGEIQVNTPAMIYAKESEPMARALLGDDLYNTVASRSGMPGGQGHKLYEQWRELPPSDPGRVELEAESKSYYSAVRRSMDGN